MHDGGEARRLRGEHSFTAPGAGDAVFAAMPLMFAIGVVIAFTNNDGVAALAASVGYVVLLGTMSGVAKIFNPARIARNCQVNWPCIA